MPAAIHAVVIGPLDDSFFAVEEDKLQRILQLEIPRASRKFQEPRGTGTTVIGADETHRLEKLRVVMAGDSNNGRLRTCTPRPNVHHVLKAAGRPRIEFVQFWFKPCLFQF